MGIFQGKIWAALIILISIVLMVREGQFGNAVAMLPQLLGQQEQASPASPAPVPNSPPAVVQPAQTADVPQTMVPAPAVSAPTPQQAAPDPNRYVVKTTAHLWEVQDGQMVQTDELLKGVIVENLGPYQSTTNYTEVAELDTSGTQIKTGAILNDSIEPVSSFSSEEEASIASDPPSAIYLTIQSVRIVENNTASQNDRHQQLMTLQRELSGPHAGCCRPPPHQTSSPWFHPVRPAPIIGPRYNVGHFHVGSSHGGGHR